MSSASTTTTNRGAHSPIRAATPSQLRQEIAFLNHKLGYQQQLLEDERRITDDLLVTKNKAIDDFQQKINDMESMNESNLETLKQRYDDDLAKAENEWRRRWESEKATYQLEKTMLQSHSDKQSTEFQSQLTTQLSAAKKGFESDLYRVQEEHRKALRKFSVQSESSTEALKSSHAIEMEKMRQDARHAVQSTLRKMDLQTKNVRKELDGKITEMTLESEKKDEIICELKDKCVVLSRAMDKKVDEMSRAFGRDIEKMRDKSSQDLEEQRRQFGDLVRKLEQRCYRFEQEKNTIKQAATAELDQIAATHKEEIAKMNDEKFKYIDALKKEHEARLKSMHQSCHNDISLERQHMKHQADMVLTEASLAADKVQQEHTARHQQQTDRIATLEQMIQKLRMQTVLQDSYWRKKQEQFQAETKGSMSSLQNAHDSLLKTQKLESTKYKASLDERERVIRDFESQLGACQNRISELRIEIDARTMQHRDDVSGLTKQYNDLREDLSQSLLAQEVFRRKSQDAERDLQDKSAQFKRIQSQLRSLETEKPAHFDEQSRFKSPVRSSVRDESRSRAPPMDESNDERMEWRYVADTGPRVVLHDDYDQDRQSRFNKSPSRSPARSERVQRSTYL